LAAKAKGSAFFVALTIRHFCTLKKQRTIRLSLVDCGGEWKGLSGPLTST
jgi:hypothetical protein